MEDRQVLKRIKDLVDEEQHLYGKDTLSAAERSRLDVIQVELDQCWDLLRQRRALREFGEDPNKAHMRPADVVEHYRQ